MAQLFCVFGWPSNQPVVMAGEDQDEDIVDLMKQLNIPFEIEEATLQCGYTCSFACNAIRTAQFGAILSHPNSLPKIWRT